MEKGTKSKKILFWLGRIVLLQMLFFVLLSTEKIGIKSWGKTYTTYKKFVAWSYGEKPVLYVKSKYSTFWKSYYYTYWFEPKFDEAKEGYIEGVSAGNSARIRYRKSDTSSVTVPTYVLVNYSKMTVNEIKNNIKKDVHQSDSFNKEAKNNKLQVYNVNRISNRSF